MRTRQLWMGLAFSMVGVAALAEGPSDPSANATAPRAQLEREIILRIAKRQLRELADGDYRLGTWDQVRANRPPEGVNWVYPWGVSLLGLLRTSEVTGERSLDEFVVRHNEILARYWHYLRAVSANYSRDHEAEVRAYIGASSIRRVMRLGSLDNAGAMTAQMVETFLRHGARPTPEEQELIETTARYVSSEQARLPDGTFWRPETNQTLWVDDLFMGCSLLTRWYEFTKDRRFIDDAAKQVLGMAALQQDKDGLWFHARHMAEKRPAPFKWGRANGWVAVATAEVLTVLPEDHPDRPRVLDVFRHQIEGLKPLQAPSGMWRQVLDHPELWEETSCTSMFAFALARGVRIGVLPQQDLEIARRAFAGLARHVSEEGAVSEASEGTMIGTDLAYYANRRRPADDQHAPGPVMLAGAEILAAQSALAPVVK